MTDPFYREALTLIVDPSLGGKTWPEVVAGQKLDPDCEVEGESYCTLMYSLWLFANVTRHVLADDRRALTDFLRENMPNRFGNLPDAPLSAGPCACAVPRPDGAVLWCRECRRNIHPDRVPRTEAAP